MYRNLARIVVAFAEAVGKAFTRAVQEEMNASRNAAQRQAHQATSSASRFAKEQEATRANAKMGITLQVVQKGRESMQILDVREPLEASEVDKRYNYLFEANAKTKGGTLYLQSKVFRAKQRLDEELARIANDMDSKEARQQQQKTDNEA